MLWKTLVLWQRVCPLKLQRDSEHWKLAVKVEEKPSAAGSRVLTRRACWTGTSSGFQSGPSRLMEPMEGRRRTSQRSVLMKWTQEEWSKNNSWLQCTHEAGPLLRGQPELSSFRSAAGTKSLCIPARQRHQFGTKYIHARTPRAVEPPSHPSFSGTRTQVTAPQHREQLIKTISCQLTLSPHPSIV